MKTPRSFGKSLSSAVDKALYLSRTLNINSIDVRTSNNADIGITGKTIKSTWSLWRRLYNDDLNDLYSSPNIVRMIKSRRMRWAGHVARMAEERGVYGVLVGKPEGRRPLGRPRRRWVANIRMDLQEVGCRYMDWIGLALDRERWRTLVSAVMNLGVP